MFFGLVGVISAVCIVWLYVDMLGASLQIPASSDFYKFIILVSGLIVVKHVLAISFRSSAEAVSYRES